MSGLHFPLSIHWPDGTDDQRCYIRQDVADDLFDALQQFVNGVETHMIDSPADDILASVTNRARKALAKARGDQ